MNKVNDLEKAEIKQNKAIRALIHFVIILFNLLFYLFCAALEAAYPPLDEECYHSQAKATALTVILLSLILCPVCLLGLAAHYGVAIEWFMVFIEFLFDVCYVLIRLLFQPVNSLIHFVIILFNLLF